MRKIPATQKLRNLIRGKVGKGVGLQFPAIQEVYEKKKEVYPSKVDKGLGLPGHQTSLRKKEVSDPSNRFFLFSRVAKLIKWGLTQACRNIFNTS